MIRFALILLLGVSVPSALSAAPVGAFFAAVGGAFAGSQVGALLLKTVLSVGLSLLAQKLQGKPKAPGMQTNTRTSGGVEPQRIIFGRAAVFGHKTYQNSTGKNRRDLITVVELCDLPGATLEAVLIDGEETRLVNTGSDKGLELSAREDHAWIRYHDGSQDFADSKLVADFGQDADRPWTTAHKLKGISYAVFTARFSREKFPRGEPELRYVMKGIPLYDPRKDSSVGGSGVQRWTDQTTWSNSENPIVIVYNIMRGIALPGGHVWGGQVDAEDLPLSQWVAAMNVCDERVTTASGGSRARYVAGLEVSLDREPADVIEDFLRACDGQIAELGGIWKVVVGEPGSAAAHITDDDIVVTEPEQYSPFKGLDAVHNAVSVKMTSPGALWQAHDLELIRDAAMEAEDGERRTANITLPAVNVEAQGAQIGLANLRDGRRFRQHQQTLPPDLFFIEPLETLSWTSSWNSYSAKLFELAEVVYDLERLLVTVSMRERDPADFVWSPVQEVPPWAPTVTSIPHVDAGLPGFTVVPHVVRDAAGLLTRPAILATWNATLIADTVAGLEIELRMKDTAEVVWRTTLQRIDAGQLVIQSVMPATDYQVRVRSLSERRSTMWLSWQEVTTPDVRVTAEDLAAAVWDRVDKDAERRAMAAVQLLRETDHARQFFDLEFHAERGIEAMLDRYNQDEASKVSLAQTRQELVAGIDGANAAIVTERTARADADVALADELTTITAQVEDQNTTITQQATAIAGLGGTIRYAVNVNGQISGWALASEIDPNNPQAGAYSNFAFVADRFAISSPDGTVTPFVTYTTPTVIDGVEIPAGTYIQGGMIRASHLSSLAARIGTISSAAAGARVELSDKGIRVYDSAGRITAAIGDLTGLL